MLTLSPEQPDYPRDLLLLPNPQPITLSRPLPAGTAVAIVGSRRPSSEARDFAFGLAHAVASRGGVVVSGGALGVDRAAHEGALDAGGRTICVVGTGASHVFPPSHGPLYERVAASEGAMVWPFPHDRPAQRGQFLRRNGVLVALSRVVVVVQASFGSGALNAAAWARRLGRPVWAVPQPPWASHGFEGCLLELDRGARPLTSVKRLLRELGLDSPVEPPPPSPSPPASSNLPLFAHFEEETTAEKVLRALGKEPRHRDELAGAAQLSIAAVTTALLTLTLENVVEEGPLGFFSRVGK